MSQCQGHSWCSVRADTRSYCSLVCVQSLCQSHPTSTLFVWSMESRHNLLYLYYLTVTEIGMLECCILNTILRLSRKNQDNRLCLCMWQRGVWRRDVKCAAGTSSRMIYLLYFSDLCLSVVSAVCMLRAFQIILSHTWPLIAFVSRGLRGSGQWPHTGTSGTLWSRRKADSYQPRWFTSVFCRY